MVSRIPAIKQIPAELGSGTATAWMSCSATRLMIPAESTSTENNALPSESVGRRTESSVPEIPSLANTMSIRVDSGIRKSPLIRLTSSPPPSSSSPPSMSSKSN